MFESLKVQREPLPEVPKPGGGADTHTMGCTPAPVSEIPVSPTSCISNPRVPNPRRPSRGMPRCGRYLPRLSPYILLNSSNFHVYHVCPITADPGIWGNLWKLWLVRLRSVPFSSFSFLPVFWLPFFYTHTHTHTPPLLSPFLRDFRALQIRYKILYQDTVILKIKSGINWKPNARKTKGKAERCSSANYNCKYYANLSWHSNGESEFKCGDNAGILNVQLRVGRGPINSSEGERVLYMCIFLSNHLHSKLGGGIKNFGYNWYLKFLDKYCRE